MSIAVYKRELIPVNSDTDSSPCKNAMVDACNPTHLIIWYVHYYYRELLTIRHLIIGIKKSVSVSIKKDIHAKVNK